MKHQMVISDQVYQNHVTLLLDYLAIMEISDKVDKCNYELEEEHRQMVPPQVSMANLISGA